MFIVYKKFVFFNVRRQYSMSNRLNISTKSIISRRLCNYFDTLVEHLYKWKSMLFVETWYIADSDLWQSDNSQHYKTVWKANWPKALATGIYHRTLNVSIVETASFSELLQLELKRFAMEIYVLERPIKQNFISVIKFMDGSRAVCFLWGTCTLSISSIRTATAFIKVLLNVTSRADNSTHILIYTELGAVLSRAEHAGYSTYIVCFK